MKNKKTLLISISCLILVTLLLMGLTYAYYRTRIIGNDSNEPSISVQSKKMEITYKDGVAELSSPGKIVPPWSATKTFYVENTGDQPIKYSIVLENMNNEFERNQDWEYVLTENGIEIASGNLAVGTHQILSGNRTIAETKGTVNTYVLTIKYLDIDEDQTVDMGASLSFKVNIKDETYTWDTAPNGSLLYALKNNQPTGSEETIPGPANSTTNEARILETEDDYGISHVYRGNVKNNYITYSNMCWRIVRVQGDGTIKLVLADFKHPCGTSNGYDENGGSSPVILDAEGDPILIKYVDTPTNTDADVVFENSNIPRMLKAELLDSNKLDITHLAETDWCNDVSVNGDFAYDYNADGVKDVLGKYYGAGNRLYNYSYNFTQSCFPSLKCNFKGENNSKSIRYNNTLGLLTGDEVVYAGYAGNGGGEYTYLYTNHEFTSNLGYDYSIQWLMTPDYKSNIFQETVMMALYHNGVAMDYLSVGTTGVVRPAIVLNSNVLLDTNTTYTQDGTIDKPYVIK